jgi:hypothetical protein
LVISAHPGAFAQSIYIKHYTSNDGLAGNHVYMSHQDNKGYLWIATTSGLSRFDGKKFKTYDYENGLQDHEVLFVSNDADNNIWVNTFSAIPSISVIKGDSVKNYPYTSIKGSIEGMSFSAEYYSKHSKTAYLSGFNALIYIRRDATPIAKTVPLQSWFRIFETEDRNIFAGDGSNLFRIRDTTVSFFQSLNLHTPAAGQSYYNDTLFVSVGNTIRSYHYGIKQFDFIQAVTLNGKIRLIHADQYGLWVTYTNKKGLYLYRAHNLNDKPVEIRIPGFVNYFMNDREGGIWISTTDNGIFYMPSPGIINYTAADGLASSVINAIDLISENRLWIGNNIGDVELATIRNNTIEIIQKINLGSDQHSNTFISDIVHDTNNKTYILSRSDLSLLQGKQLKTISKTGAHKSLLMINDTLLGIGGWNYEVLNLRSGRSDVSKIGRIYAQVVDTGYNLWLGGIRGLFHKQLFGKQKFYQVKGLENIKINALAVYGPYIWAGSQNNGLYLIKNDSIIERFTYKNTPGLPSNTIKALAINNNELWVGTNRGLFCGKFVYNDQKFADKVIIDHNDGLLSPEINKIRISGSKVFIASYGGITILNKPVNMRLNYTLDDIFIKDLNNDRLTKADTVEIPYTSKGIEIGFQTVAFRYNNEITYSYKLEPFHNEWRSTKDNLLQYTNIPPGEYNFLVQIHDRRGNSSKLIKAASIHITPLFWQTTWFKCLMVFAVLLLFAVLLYGYYSYTKKRTNEKLLQAKAIAKAKLEALRAQLKPHFIFNSLNAIKDYIYNNKNDDAANLLQGFAGLIRKGLHLADKDFTTIGEEVIFLKQYLELERLKCDACFDYRFEVPEKITGIVIPSLITQPFIENAAVHGIRSVKNGRAVVHITYSLRDNDVMCSISDNGIGINQSILRKKTGNSLGTILSKDRISYFKTGLGVDIELDIKDKSENGSEEHGTTITLTIKNALNLSGHENRNQNADH